MPSDSVLRTNPSAWSRALKHVIDHKLISMKELAEEAECSQRHLYNVANEQAALAHDKAERISRYAQSEYGITSLAEAHNTPEFTVIQKIFGSANGEIRTEVIRIVKAVASADDHFEELDADGMKEALQLLRAALADLEAEWALMRSAV